jgi:hypothetical protein
VPKHVKRDCSRARRAPTGALPTSEKPALAGVFESFTAHTLNDPDKPFRAVRSRCGLGGVSKRCPNEIDCQCRLK